MDAAAWRAPPPPASSLVVNGVASAYTSPPAQVPPPAAPSSQQFVSQNGAPPYGSPAYPPTPNVAERASAHASQQSFQNQPPYGAAAPVSGSAAQPAAQFGAPAAPTSMTAPLQPAVAWPVAPSDADLSASPLGTMIAHRLAEQEETAAQVHARGNHDMPEFTALGDHLSRASNALSRDDQMSAPALRAAMRPAVQPPGHDSMAADRRSLADMFRVLSDRTERSGRRDVFASSNETDATLFRRL